MPAFVPQGQRARGRRGGGGEGGYALGSAGSGRTDPALRACARAGRTVTGQFISQDNELSNASLQAAIAHVTEAASQVNAVRDALMKLADGDGATP